MRLLFLISYMRSLRREIIEDEGVVHIQSLHMLTVVPFFVFCLHDSHDFFSHLSDTEFVRVLKPKFLVQSRWETLLLVHKLLLPHMVNMTDIALLHRISIRLDRFRDVWGIQVLDSIPNHRVVKLWSWYECRPACFPPLVLSDLKLEFMELLIYLLPPHICHVA
jgi:hypothetical protein